MELHARDDRRRPNDADDLLALAAVAGEQDWQSARETAGLIIDRGFGRGHDLIDGLDELRRT